MKKNNIKNLIFAVLFLLLTVGSFYMTLRQMNIYHKGFLDLTNLYKEKELKNQEIKALNNLISEIGDEIKIIDSHFLTIENIPNFLDELEKNAQTLRVKAEVVSVDNLGLDNKSFVINTKVSGSFDDLYNFLLLLENYKYELEILDMKIVEDPFTQKADGTPDIPNWSGYFKIKVISFVN